MLTRDFEGGVFSEGIEGGRSGARVVIEASCVRATTPEGQDFRVPFSACQLELGGASGRMWFCRLPDRSVTIFCEAPGFEQALEESGRRYLSADLERIRAVRTRSARRSFAWWSLSLALVAGVLFGGYWVVRSLGRGAVLALPISVDEKIGELSLENLPLEGEVVRDPVLTSAVRQIVDRLAPHAGKQFHFDVRVVEAPVLNAFALPGGPIVVYTGLLRAADSPEQVAGVLGHEMAHVTLRHGVQRIAQSLGVVAAVQLLFGDASGVLAVAAEVLREGTINSYSRESEHEADMVAVRTLRAAHVDPRALADFFALLEKKDGKLPQAIAWLGTHPELAARVRDVRAEATRLGAIETTRFDLDWAEVQKRAGAAPEPP